MTNLWSNSLPVELLQRILLYVKSEMYLDDRDIFQCIQVCKSWKYTAQVIGYSRISLNKPSQIDSMERSMTNYSYSPGRHVKSVYYEAQPHHHYLPILAVLFPLVEHINTFSLDASFYETLIALHQQFKLTKLKSFSPQYTYASPISFSRYVECAMEYSNTLTKFECRGRDSLEVTREERFTNCFPHLQELSIYNTDYNKELTINSFDSIIDGFKNLKSFKFETSYMESNINPINIAMIQPQPGIERLVARMPITNNDDILDYISHKFPKLKELHLANNWSSYYNPDDKCILARIVKFLGYVSASVPKYDIQLFEAKETATNYIVSQFFALPANDKPNKSLELEYRQLPEHCSATSESLCFLQDNTLLSKVIIVHRMESPEIYFLSATENMAAMEENEKNMFYDVETYRISFYLPKKNIILCSPNLKSLCIMGQQNMVPSSIPLNEILEPNTLRYLNRLEFLYCTFSKNFFFALSRVVPKLKVLKLVNYMHNRADNQVPEPSSVFLVNMPSTSISLFCVENCSYNTYFTTFNGKVFLELSTSNSTSSNYFSIHFLAKGNPRPPPQVITAKEFHEEARKLVCTSKVGPFIVSLKCLSVQTILFKYSRYGTAVIENTMVEKSIHYA